MSKEEITRRIENLREKMQLEGVDAYLIVSDDFHASEYVGDYFKCREYISGFDGSAGTVVVLQNECALWTDGRYFLQAEQQLSGTDIILQKMGEPGVPTVLEYLKENMSEAQCLGYDGRTIQESYGRKVKKQLSGKHITYKENLDLVGEIWENRPALSKEPIWILEEKYAGQSAKSKLESLRRIMQEKGADYHLLATLDDIAWLYNFRGNDIAYNPVALAYTIVGKDTATLYIDEKSINEKVKQYFEEELGVSLCPYLQVYEDIKNITVGTILLDENRVNVALCSNISSSVNVRYEVNPTLLLKAIKNSTEIENERKAHIEDGVAVAKLIYWLKKMQHSESFLNGEITELSVAKYLEELRQQREGYIEQSFAPIIATGSHGAIVHYEASAETSVPLENNNFVLMDTGGQYYQGTTDITRTVAIGELTRQQKEHYTAVLRGNLNLAAAHFKYGCTGVNLDYLARQPLWELGLDYNHGTGHGVGYLLNVHEGPNAIRMKNAGGKMGATLEAGMITSDEPGVYLENQYGIRLENLILCKNAEKTEMGQFMEFETLTMVPFDRDAILSECMSEREKELLNQYHRVVYDKLCPNLSREESEWLQEVTAPIE